MLMLKECYCFYHSVHFVKGFFLVLALDFSGSYDAGPVHTFSFMCKHVMTNCLKLKTEIVKKMQNKQSSGIEI